MTRGLLLVLVVGLVSACAPHKIVAVPMLPVILTVHDGLILLPALLADQVKVCLTDRLYQHPTQTVFICTDVGAVRHLARTALATED